MVTYTDKLVGRVVHTLDELGIRENTLVLFSGDNGTASQIVSPFKGMMRKGGKGSRRMIDANVPLIANWPGRVSVISGDGQGVAGIDFRICPAMGFHDDITVRGFDYGIRSLPYHMTHNSLEFITLENQNKAGVLIGECSASIRKLHSKNHVPAVHLARNSGQVVMLDSILHGLDDRSPAIDALHGQLFVRNVHTSGYGSAIQATDKSVVDTSSLAEFVTGPVFSLRRGQQKRSLSLPIEETPESEWPVDFSQWANVDDYGAKGNGESDDSAAVQAAMDSGRPVVYFPKSVYRLRSPVSIPGTVRRIMAFYGTVLGSMSVAESSQQPLLMEDFGTETRMFVRHEAPRTLVLSHMRCSYHNQNRTPGAKAFINNCNGLGKTDRVFKNGRFWVRFMNTEYKAAPNFTCNASDMWVFGYKVEGHMTNFESINGGRLEVLGGICNEHGSGVEPETPIMRNVDSSLCYVGYTKGPNRFETIVEETIQGETRRLKWENLPSRPGSGKYRRWNDVFVPLYVSVSPSTQITPAQIVGERNRKFGSASSSAGDSAARPIARHRNTARMTGSG